MQYSKPIIVDDIDVPDLNFSEQEIEFYLISVYSGIITKNNLSVEYHYRLAAYLEQALYEGFGSDLNINFLSQGYETLRALRSHIYVFSAAKQYTQVREMSAFINIRGEISSFKEFKDLAGGVFDVYNKNYLRTEYNTAVGQAQMASQWVDFVEQQNTLPMLTYRTQKDARVRDEHAALEGITRPVNDPFWNTFMPKNGWNCRCFVTQHDNKRATDLSKRDLSATEDEKKFPKVFRMNPGKDRLVFNPKHHPYFRVAKGDKGFREANYNLPIL